MEVLGRRVPDDTSPHKYAPGEYGKYLSTWYASPPCNEGVDEDLLANLAVHRVTVHEDGTITASPSVLVSNGRKSWHGYLEKGIWREV
jgi:hypothetical protein